MLPTSNESSILKGQPVADPKPTKYAYIVLGLLLFIYICN
jgi:hypothetical protein